MAMADEFRAMTQDIAASYDVRMGEFASMRQQISEMLGDFRKTRLHDAKGYRADRRRAVSDIKNEVPGLLGGFTKEREEMGAAWHDLISSMRTKRGQRAEGSRSIPLKKASNPTKKGRRQGLSNNAGHGTAVG